MIERVATTLTAPDAEAPSSTFTQPATGMDYEVERQAGKLIHREIVRSTDGEAIAETEQPILYTVGSGQHGKSYLYQVK